MTPPSLVLGCCAAEEVSRCFGSLSVAEQRYQAVFAAIEDGLEVSKAAATAGVTLQAVHSWLSRCAEAA